MKCPECGADMMLKETKKFLNKDGTAKKFFSCSCWPQCNGTHGAHPNGKPLGVPANAATKLLRREAHHIFDEAYCHLSMKERYEELQSLMNMSEAEAHIGKFNAEQCHKLILLLTPEKGNP